MKSSIMRFVVIVGLLSLSATVAMAKTAGSIAPAYVVELTASVPSFPDLPQEDDFLRGDVTGDGLVNVLDIIALVNIIMQVPGQPCGCVAPVTYEGQTYTTVQIGDQCWLRENLNVGTMVSATSNQTNNSMTEKYCFGNNPDNCAT